MSSAIPVIEASDDADAFCIGCPNSEMNTFYTVYGHDVRAELFIVFVMPPLTYKEDVKVGKHRKKSTYCLLILSINAVHAENLKWVPVISLDNKLYLFFQFFSGHGSLPIIL